MINDEAPGTRFALPPAVPASALSAALVGSQAVPVDVQVDLALGLPGFFLIGLPDSACIDAKVRVQTALRNSGFTLPHKRITINLAPAEVRKEGAAFDLAMALGILGAAGVLPPGALDRTLLLGELGLSGEVLPIRGALPASLAGLRAGAKEVLLPAANAREAALVEGVEAVAIQKLSEAVEHLRGQRLPSVGREPAGSDEPLLADLADVRGQAAARRALEIAAAGEHNLLLIGSPGSGKTMLAQRLPGILTPLSFEEMLEATCIWSAAGRTEVAGRLLRRRPFRSPHHTVSVAGLVGGGSPPRPGEISLSHRGVLFLDELPEFGRASLEALRQPLEEGVVSIARASGSITLPAQFLLVAAMNPCPCGHATDPDPDRCSCSLAARASYRRRVSGPILDRFDLQIEAPRLVGPQLEAQAAESSAEVRRRVMAARAIQARRYAAYPGVFSNGQVRGRGLRELLALSAEALPTLSQGLDVLRLSARAHDKVLRVARTIADLEGCAQVHAGHIQEALAYRALDRPLGPTLPRRPEALEQALRAPHPHTPGIWPEAEEEA